MRCSIEGRRTETLPAGRENTDALKHRNTGLRADDDLAPTRYSLLNQLQDWGDDESWRVFFDTYWRLIYSVAIKAGLSDSEAQEVVQETIICVARNIHKFKRDRHRGTFKGWLQNLTRWRIADQFKKRTGLMRGEAAGGRQYHPLEEIPDMPDEIAGMEWEQEWQQNLVQAAIRRVKLLVKEEQFQLFDLYVVNQWPVARVCQTLGVSSAQVYLAKHRITRLLRKQVRLLEKEWNAT
jgi:RNA polymerase sigma factor (sigma-70 family)